MPTPSRFLPSAIFIISIAILAGCSGAPATTPESRDTAAVARDAHSYAEPETARVTHVSLDLVPDFDTRKISGTAKLSIQRSPDLKQSTALVPEIEVRRGVPT